MIQRDGNLENEAAFQLVYLDPCHIQHAIIVAKPVMRNRTASRSLDIQQVGYHEEGVVDVDEDAGLEVAASLPVVEEVGQLHMPPTQQLNWAEFTHGGRKG